MATLADIQAALSAEKTEEDKIVGLLQQVRADNAALAADLAAAIAANDPAALQAVADQMNANTAAMQAAETALVGQAPQPAP